MFNERIRHSLFRLAAVPLIAALLPAQTTLRQAAVQRNLLMGAAADADEFGNPDPLVLEPLYGATLGTQYSMLEPENAMKWQVIRPSQNVFDFQPGDELVAFAQAHQMHVRGHNLCWELANPTWLTTLAATATPATMAGLLQTHITTVMTHYMGQVFAWDVVNEAVSDTQTGTGTVMKDSIWYNQPGIGLTGTGYVEQAFRWARAADPNALLFYNDYNIENPGPKFNAVYAMVKDFLSRGVPIDGVGIQMHVPETGYPSIYGLAQNIQQLTALGVQVHITEMDVRLPVNASGVASASDLQTQAQTYQRILTVCLQNPGCTAFQTWGFSDKHSDIPTSYPGYGAALPFDLNYQPKPAFAALLSVLENGPPPTLPPLNLSHDLVANGFAPADMVPNMPALDSTPLFQSAIFNASQYNIPVVMADRGSYYFLSQNSSSQHVYISPSAMTIDFQYSDLYFANGNVVGLWCGKCSNVTLQNFTADYLNLPFTQVAVTAVNATARTISYQTIPGWPEPSALNTYTATGGIDAVFIFRNGQLLAGTGHMAIAIPSTAGSLQITDANPWAQSSYLSAIQPGDIAVVEYVGNGGAVFVANGSNVTLRNISAYSSGNYGFDVFNNPNTTLDQVQVIPRPGTDRLVSTPADGIHISVSATNSVISNSTIRRAAGDGISIDGQWYATVNAPSSTATVAIKLIQYLTVPPGMSFDFIDIANGTVIGTATATAVDPPLAQQTATAGEVLTLTLSTPINGLQQGYGVIPSDPSLRGGGSVIRNNLVQEDLFARGIYVPGVENLTVTDNLVDSTNNSGILVGEDDVNNSGFYTGPVSGVTIHNNIVSNALEYGVPTGDSVKAAAAINTYVTDENYKYVTTTPESNFSITGNFIANTVRSGIRVESLNGGTLTGNTILNAAQQPNAYIWSATSGESMAQLEADFQQAVVAANSVNVTTSPNTTTGSIVTSISDAGGGLRLAPGAIASAFGANLASATAAAATAVLPTSLGGVSVTVTDNAGTARQAGLFYVSPGQINYQVPMGTAPGVARVTIGSAVGGILVGTVAPGLFSANGTGNGVAAADAVRVAADGTQTPLSVFQCGASGCASTPMSLGAATDTLIVEFFGTGIQGFSSLTNVVAQVNGVPAQVQFAGATQSAGLDQVNIVIPASLAGAGEVPVILMVDGQTANVVTINVQ